MSGTIASPLGKILVVDDEATMRRSLADILRLEGYQVQTVSSGKLALEALGKDIYDVILLDLKMPGMDGLEVLRIASRIAPDAMVILLTAHGSLESAIEAIRYQAHDYILKPATPQQIITSIARAIRRRTELLHNRALMERKEAYLSEKREVSQETEPGIVALADNVLVDLERREMWGGNRSQETEKVRLTPTEARLLKVLLENRGRVLTHRDLVLLVQGYEVTDWEAPEVLRPLVSRLRQKLNRFPRGESWIVNVRGTGYVLERRQIDRGPSDGVERRSIK